MNENKSYESIFVARQPIMDKKNATWGYLSLFRDSHHADRAIFSDTSEATMHLIANLPLCGGVGGEKVRQMIHFTPDEILNGAQYAVPWPHTALILEETTKPTEALIRELRKLKNDKYEIAINNFEGNAGSEPLTELADLLLVDVNQARTLDLCELTHKWRQRSNARFIAKRVQSAKEYDHAKEAGFDLFHGFFFKRPLTKSGRKISSTETTRLKLFDIIEKDEPDFDALTPAIEADVSISYRLLNFLNSANFGFVSKVTSIRQAVILAGWKPIRNWLRLVILTDLIPSEKSMELAYTSAHRAKLFETAALGGGYEDESDTLFMLGLFSMLHTFLDMDMKEIIETLPIETAIKDALCGKPNRYFHWLNLAEAIEQSHWETVSEKAHELGIPPSTVAVSYQHALTWVEAFFTDMPNKSRH